MAPRRGADRDQAEVSPTTAPPETGLATVVKANDGARVDASIVEATSQASFGRRNFFGAKLSLRVAAPSILRGFAASAHDRPRLASKAANRTATDFIMQDWIDHRDALEILVCYRHAANLKYDIDKDGGNILPATPSTVLVNFQVLRYFAAARRHFPDPGGSRRAIVDFVRDIEHRHPTLRGASAIIR